MGIQGPLSAHPQKLFWGRIPQRGQGTTLLLPSRRLKGEFFQHIANLQLICNLPDPQANFLRPQSLNRQGQRRIFFRVACPAGYTPGNTKPRLSRRNAEGSLLPQLCNILSIQHNMPGVTESMVERQLSSVVFRNQSAHNTDILPLTDMEAELIQRPGYGTQAAIVFFNILHP